MTRAASREIPKESPSIPTNSPQYTLAGTGSINARIDPTITKALIRASMERRIAGETPSTHRDIIAEALSGWLRARGYLR